MQYSCHFAQMRAKVALFCDIFKFLPLFQQTDSKVDILSYSVTPASALLSASATCFSASAACFSASVACFSASMAC